MQGYFSRAIVACAMVVLLSTAVHAEVLPVESSTDTCGATIITWTSAYEDLDYTAGAEVVLTVSWTVEAGMAEYEDAVLRHYTPKSKKDPAVGTDPTFSYPGSDGDNSVDIAFSFTEMHLCSDRNVEIGNGHFTFLLMVDEDGDGEVETVARFGTNIHVEDPQ